MHHQKRIQRKRFINKNVDVEKLKLILEIGALNKPTFRKRKNVKYLDWFSTDELAKMYPHRVGNIQPIDYVVKSLNFNKVIKDSFDFIAANHVGEHIPNFIFWLKNIDSILNKNGYLFLTLPHKDYTFDYLRPTTSITTMLDRFYRNVNVPEIKDVFEQKYFYRPIKKLDGWNSVLLKEKINKPSFKSIEEAWSYSKKLIRRDGYVDVHCNVFTLSSFLNIINVLFEENLINLKAIVTQDVLKHSNEFHVLLQKQ